MPAPEVLTPQLPPAALADVAARFAPTAQRRHAWVEHRPHGRWYELVHRDAAYDVWVVGWGHAQGIELHDHGGSAGAVRVVEGQLVEAHTDRRSQGRVRRRRVGTGEAIAFGPDHVHDLVNPGPGVAISVHVYSPPLLAMTFYDDGPGTFLARTRTELADALA